MKTNNNTKLVGGLEAFSNITVDGQKRHLVGEDSYMDKGVSSIDFFNLKGLTDGEIELLIAERLGIGTFDLDGNVKGLNEKGSLNKIQNLYDRAIEIYQNELLIDLRKPFTKQKFKSKDDILNFCKNTYNCNAKDRRQLYCDIIKIIYWLAQIDNCPALEHIEDEAINYVNQNIVNTGDFNFDISELFENMKGSKESGVHKISGEYMISFPIGGEKRIPIILKFRGKKKEKMILKAFYSDKGIDNIYDLIKDSIGIEIEVESKQDAFYILQHYYNRLTTGVNRKIEDFSQKPGFFEEDDIKNAMQDDILSKEFKKFILENWSKTKKKKTGNGKYKDAKIIARNEVQVEDGIDTLFAELRVTLKDNKNQSGLASNEVINGKKKILAMVGLRGWVSRSYIKRILEHTLNKGVKKDQQKIVDEYTKDMVQINVPGSKRVIYTTEDRIERILKTASEYPPIIIQAIRRHSPRLREEYNIDRLVDGVREAVVDIENGI